VETWGLQKGEGLLNMDGLERGTVLFPGRYRERGKATNKEGN